MNDGGGLHSQFLTLLPLALAAVGWYVASRLAVEGIAGRSASSLRRGAAQAIPLLVLSLIAIVRHQPQIAIGVVFGACVATLSLVFGVVTFTAPPEVITLDARRKWGFVLPTAVLLFLCGFQSHLTLLHALVLAIQGVAVLFVWTGQPEVMPAPSDPDVQPLRLKPLWIAPMQIVLAIAIAMAAGWAGVSGAGTMLQRSSLPSMSIIAALLLGPAMVIPMIGNDAALAERGQYTQAITSQVVFVLVALCVVLPLAVFGWYADASMRDVGKLSLDAMLRAETESPLMFPLIVWRVDCVMLMVLGLTLLPLSLGRWLPGKFEGMLLILLYVAYMVLWRWGSAMS